MALSLALNGATCGGIILTPLLVFLTERYGFAAAMAIMTAAMAVLLVPLAAFVGGVPVSGAAVRPSNGSPAMTKAAALRSPHFWTVAGPFALALVAQVGFIVHMIAFLSPIVGRAGAGLAVSVMTVMAVVGRVGVGTMIDRLDQRLASAAAFASQAAALAIMIWTVDATALLLACALFGFSVGNLITFPALIIQREFDPAAFGVLAALTTAITQFTYAFGPGLLGIIRDATGGYPAALALCVGFDLVAAVIVLIRLHRVAKPSGGV
jgi:cyanate permease